MTIKDSLLLVNFGDHEAHKKVMQSQCGFKSSLPKVCCNNRRQDDEPQIPRKVETLEKLPAPVALISGKQKKPQNAWGIKQKGNKVIVRVT